jgi:hypothetical protein
LRLRNKTAPAAAEMRRRRKDSSYPTIERDEMKRGTRLLASWLLGSLLLGGLLAALIGRSPVVAADGPRAKPDAGKLDAGKPDSAKQDPNKQEAARVRYARTYLALAKLDVQIADDRNKQFPNTLPPGIMVVLEQRVALAEQWLKAAQPDSDSKPGDIAVRIAEIYLKTAEASYAQAERVNRVSPMSPRALERARLKIDLAKGALATAKELDASSPDALLQFEIDRLREEVADMHVRQIELLDRN